jgi:uncharacterized iron-regulated membrane protein
VVLSFAFWVLGFACLFVIGRFTWLRARNTQHSKPKTQNSKHRAAVLAL